jgi:hypothetical protein
MLNRTQLSFIQLGGGIAVGVHVILGNHVWLPTVQVSHLGVRTATAQVCFPLSNDITSQIWLVGSALGDIMIPICMTYYVGFSNLILESDQLMILVHSGSFRDMIPP